MIIKGQKIDDRYQIIRMIGEGGMANVYLAYDTILDRNVAVKILRGDLAGDEKFVRRFQREARSASSLSHPNIVELYDVGEDDGKYFIVMEYVDGKNLKTLVKKRGGLTIKEVIDIMLQLTSAVAAAHNSYIIHRDIKPQNVMILDDGTIKVMDFGIALAMNNSELTQTNSVMGSVHYLPPEQANGSGSTIKSDIYSLGILMYELLTGKIPFKGDNAVEIAIKQMKEPIPRVTKSNPDIPQSIENVVLRACAKNPKNRYNSVNEMHDDIKHALDPDRQDEEMFEYKYPETDLGETKEFEPIKLNKDTGEVPSRSSKRTEEEIVEVVKEDKKMNVILIVLLSLIGVALLGLGGFFLYQIMFAKTPEVKVPDLTEMLPEAAEYKLKDVGLVMDMEFEEKADEKIEEGKIISTKPKKGETVKKGSTIKIIVSSGLPGVELEDYTGKNVELIKYQLEELKIKVEIVEQEGSDESLDKDIIVGQNPKAKEKVKEGETVTLYVPKVEDKYPDFVAENWKVADIEDFCSKKGVYVNTITEEVEDKSKDGRVIKQSREAGSKITQGANLVITVGKYTEPTPDPEVEETP